MAKLLVEKVFSSDTNGYDETVEFKILMCSNFSGNNNKFYCVEIQKKESKYRLFTHYGRLGSSSVYDVREKTKDGQPITYDDVKKEFDSIVKKKIKGKKKDGYIEKYEVVDVVSPTVGSDNLRKNASVEVVESTDQIKKEYQNIDVQVQKLITQICEENVHNITSMMDVTLTDNGFETPLGPVTKSHVEKARVPLIELKTILKTSQNTTEIKELNTLFFSLIPHKFGRHLRDSDLIVSEDKLRDKFELLEMLESAVDMGKSLNKRSEDRYKALGVDINIVNDSKTISRIEEYIYTTKADNHKWMNCYGINVNRIYEVKLPVERERFDKQGAVIGNVQELFHGSRNCNILSILKNGLMVFKSHPTKAGDMFGPGIYFADSSTKSANYSVGYWSGVSNKYKNNFMFLADVALGNIKEEKGAKYYTDAPSGYHSVKGCKGHSLYNNEYIIYEPHQCTLKYLVEFTL